MTSRISGTKCSAGQHTPPEKSVQRTAGQLNINIDTRPENTMFVYNLSLNDFTTDNQFITTRRMRTV